MTTFDQELAGRYVAAGGGRADVNARCIARAVFVPDTILGLYNADRKVGIDPSTTARWPSSSTQPKSTTGTLPPMSASGQ